MVLPIDNITATMPLTGVGHGQAPGAPGLTIELRDATAFRAMLDRHLASGGAPRLAAPAGPGLGERMLGRAADLSGEVQKDHEFVSKSLEQATRSGDPMQLMKAMMALSDYQNRVQFIAKATSKAVSALDQLTKLQ